MASAKTNRRDARAKGARTLSRYQQLGPMPDDPLKINAWTHRALGVAMLQVVGDPQMDEKERVAKMCELASRMKDLTPMSRISLAEDAVMGRAQGAQSGGPKMEAAEVKQHAQEVPDVDPGRGGPPALRGRPRKRSTR